MRLVRAACQYTKIRILDSRLEEGEMDVRRTLCTRSCELPPNQERVGIINLRFQLAILACKQWWDACRFQRIMRSILGQAPPERSLVQFAKRCCRPVTYGRWIWTRSLADPEDGPEENDAGRISKRHLWTMTHSHYVLMGGFAFDNKSLPHSSRRFFLCPKGVQFLGELDVNLIPDLSKQDIEDKSKSSNMGKLIVCVEALWFCTQCLNRFTRGMAISIFELHAFAHALFMFIIYVMWWDKPYDVEVSTLLQGETIMEIVSLFYTFEESGFISTVRSYKCREPGHRKRRPSLNHQLLRFPIPQEDHSRSKCSSQVFQGFTRLDFGQPFHGFFFDDIPKPSIERGYTVHAAMLVDLQHTLCTHIDLGPKEIDLLKMAEKAIQRYSLDKISLAKLQSQRKLYASGIPDWPDWPGFYGWLHRRNRSEDMSLVFVVFSTSGILSGLLYLSAWNAPFSNSHWQLWWRGSVLAVLISVPGLATLAAISWLFERIQGPNEDADPSFGMVLVIELLKLSRDFSALCFALILLIAFFSRTALLVTSFSSLWWLPDSAYDVPSWSNLIPHF
jgi:hypothetical protein